MRRSSTRIHCVIPLYSHFKTQASHAHLSSRSFNVSPSITYQTISSYRPLTYNTQLSSKKILNRVQPDSRSPADTKRLPPVISPPSHVSPFSTKTSVMSSDDAYMSFLDKANADLSTGRATQQGTDTARTETVDATTQIPTPLQSVDSYYISDTDEPFEPVALLWKGAKQGIWPSPGTSYLLSPFMSTCFPKAFPNLRRVKRPGKATSPSRASLYT